MTARSGTGMISGVGAVALGLALAGAAQAATPAQPKEAAAFQAVLDCRKLTDDVARLACFDAAAARMGEAETRGDIVIIDRAQATTAHREAFGLHVPSLEFVTRALKPEEVNRIDGVVESAHADRDGRWTFKLADGAVWRQISGDLQWPPKHGSKVSIRRGSLGSYLMNVDNQQSIKVHRDE